jgi:hypothetical protein
LAYGVESVGLQSRLASPWDRRRGAPGGVASPRARARILHCRLERCGSRRRHRCWSPVRKRRSIGFGAGLCYRGGQRRRVAVEAAESGPHAPIEVESKAENRALYVVIPFFLLATYIEIRPMQKPYFRGKLDVWGRSVDALPISGGQELAPLGKFGIDDHSPWRQSPRSGADSRLPNDLKAGAELDLHASQQPGRHEQLNHHAFQGATASESSRS